MKLKLRHKPFVSFLKKVILKLKEKAVLCIKQSTTTTQTYNVTIDKPVQEVKTDCSGFSNFINTTLSIFRQNIQNKKNIITKWGNYIKTIKGTIKNKTAIYGSKVRPKQKILEDLNYYKNTIGCIVENTDKNSLSRLVNIDWSFFCLKQITKKSRDLPNLV
ncbi:MAG: hypothetical protein ACEPOV_05705 [Hyphomicrobiales bacterium]